MASTAATDAAKPALKLTYFPLRGRAELARLCFHLGNVEFEDFRMPGSEWPAMKPTCPHHYLPQLEVGDVKLCEHNAIARYAARLGGLYPEDLLQAALVDSIMDLTADFNTAWIAAFFAKGDAKATLSTKLKDTQIPCWWGIFEKYLEGNAAGFMVGDKLSVADLAVYHATNTALDNKFTDSLDKFPKVLALVKKVSELPGIKTWNEKHGDVRP